MPLFQPKSSIHLSTDQEEVGSSRRPPSFLRKTSNWSIPCCSHISLGKSGGTIQLPDDSDNDSADEDHRQPSLSSFHVYNQESQNGSLPNAFLDAQARSQTPLSRNPFARVSSSEEEQTRQTGEPEECQIDDFAPKVSGEEELATFTGSSFTRYDDELDWTESYKDEDDEDDVKSIAKGNQIKSDDDNDTKTNVSEDTKSIPNEHNNDTSSITTSTSDKEEEDIIPQIGEEVLQLLPLPNLSNEIPPAMILKKASFEKSLYDEEPFMSGSKTHGSRVSRFSMSEEDCSVLKKPEEQENRKSSSAAIEIRLQQNHPLSTLDNESQEQNMKATFLTSVKDDSRRASSIAQSLLGDKLDDFTEKLAFIKKNIIMSIGSDDDEEDEEEISAEKILQKMEQAKSSSAIATTSNQKPLPIPHRRTSSLMDAVPTIARFMNQIGGGNTAPEASTFSTAQLSSSQTSSSSFSPSSLFSAFAGPIPESSPSLTTNKNLNDKRSIQEENEEDEELFDFNKVLEIGKNVKTFGEGFVGNGIRMFNDVATRMKTTVEEEQRRAAQTATQRDETSLSTSSTINENEWLHNYL